MKKLTLLLLLTLTAIQLQAQEPTNLSKREARRAARETEINENAQELNKILETKEFCFFAQKAKTTLVRQPFVDLSGDNYNVLVQGDMLILELPYYGKSRSVVVDRHNNPMDFEAKIDRYTTSGDLTSKKGLTLIIETQGDDNKLTRLTFTIFDNATASLQIQKQGLTDIVFSGTIEKIPQKKTKK